MMNSSGAMNIIIIIVVVVFIFIIIFYTLGIKDPEGFGNRKN